MKITSVNVRKVEKEGSRMKGIASVLLDDCFAVHIVILHIQLIQKYVVCLKKQLLMHIIMQKMLLNQQKKNNMILKGAR